MIILGMASVLLGCYQGYERLDDIVCFAAGLFGLGICLFPCASGRDVDGFVGTFQTPMHISNVLHTVCAIGFFGLLAFNSLFLFTKSGSVITKEKKKRNVVFRVCGVGMLASFALLALPIPHVTWWVELFALVFFGISWLTKANCYSWLFCDKAN